MRSNGKFRGIIMVLALAGCQAGVEGPRQVIRVPLIELDAAAGFGDAVGWDEETMREARRQGRYIGCGDGLFYMEKEVPQTTMPLTAVYEALFSLDEVVVVAGKEYVNPIHYQSQQKVIDERTYRPMRFEKVVVEGNVAKVYLTGDYVSVGTCEPPRTEAVLRFAAKQFEQIDEVEIYLNDEPARFIHGGM